MLILTVDDDDIALEMLNMALEEVGHEVVSACNGAEALKILEHQPIRMVITDWEMPEVNGLDLCRAIRSGEYGGYVYLIMITSHSGSEQTVEGLSAGADDFLTKPFNPAELEVRVRAGERILSLETRDIALFSMAKLAESRDPETGMHLDRVRNYCKILASWLAEHGEGKYQLEPHEVKMIYITSPLHDIGKIGIPDGVLLKPGRLSDREFDIMKSHTTLGAKTLDAALKQFPDAKFLQMARDIAASHHERVDGSGYPSGLTGADIPLCGRIVAVADVYDALTSKRVYKAAFNHDVARSIIVDDSGKHFDPVLVDAFIENEDKFIEICEKYQESDPAAAA